MVAPPKREVKPNEARLYFFFTNWCGFSKKAMPEWEKLETKLRETNTFGKTHVTPVRVDCEQDTATCDLYGVQGYPTIKLETREGISEFKQAVKYDKLLQFLRQTLGKEISGL
jgi:thiol-disulfide isomerase/thioredoxin